MPNSAFAKYYFRHVPTSGTEKTHFIPSSVISTYGAPFEFPPPSFLPEVFLQEVDADGLFVVVREDAAAVALDHARLAHRPVPHDHHLEHDIKKYIERNFVKNC